MNKHWKYIVLVLFLFVLTACSSDKEDTTEAAAEKPEATAKEEPVEGEEAVGSEADEYIPEEIEYYELTDTARPLTEYEKELLRKSGPYSGDSYDEAAVQAELDKLPADLTTEQYVEAIKSLLLEDYHEEVEIFANFNSEVVTSVAAPDSKIDQPEMNQAHYAILIDASGSMAADAGGITRWQAAQEAVTEFAEQIPENATISLRVYGHKGTGTDKDKAMSCESTESFYNDNYKSDAFEKALNKAQPAGWTPIALGLEKVREDIPESADDVIVYVVSDGIETCDNDPVKAASDLVDDDIQTAVNIIGFDVDNEGQKLLKDVANAGNGEFVYVGSETQLKDYMREQYELLKEEWRDWKEEGKKQARESKEEKKKLARETKESMKEKSKREKARMKEAQRYLEDRFEDYDHPSRKAISPIIDYGNKKTNYAIDIGNKLLNESIDSGNEELREYIDEGNKKINEAIDKKNDQ